MHADIGLTSVYRSIERKTNYKLEKLKKAVIFLIRELSDLICEENLIRVEYIIDPVINVFMDNKGVNSIAVNMGYNYYYDSIYEEMRHDIVRDLIVKISRNLNILIKSEYGGNFFCYGICFDNLYVASSKNKEHGIGSIYFSKKPKDLKDEYGWPGLESSIVYSIFPKDKITLPSKPK